MGLIEDDLLGGKGEGGGGLAARPIVQLVGDKGEGSGGLAVPIEAGLDFPVKLRMISIQLWILIFTQESFRIANWLWFRLI